MLTNIIGFSFVASVVVKKVMGMTDKNDRPRVIVIGGGFGGVAAARALRGADADVILIDRQNHHLFQPLLYQVATAALSPGNIAAPIRRMFSRQDNCSVIMGEVVDIDLEERSVALADRRLSYDYLVLAAGVRTNYFGRPEWARHAPGLKTVDEAVDVRGRFLLAFEQAELEGDDEARQAVLTFAIVGAGPTGVEMAGAMAEISRQTLRRDFRHFDTKGARVILVELADRVLPTFPAELSRRAQRDLEDLGVEVRLNTRVIDMGPQGLTVTHGERSECIAAHNIVWAAGVRAVGLAGRVGTPTDPAGRLEVGDDLTVLDHPEVFVVGDLAHRVDPETGRPVPGVAPAARQMGRFAGETIAGELGGRQADAAPSPRRVFRYRDKGNLATIGRNRAVADIHGRRFGGVVAFLLWAVVHVFFLVDFRRKITTFLEWVWMYVFHERGVRLITGSDRRPQPRQPLQGYGTRGGEHAVRKRQAAD
jgi:NADH dehydrogenase